MPVPAMRSAHVDGSGTGEKLRSRLLPVPRETEKCVGSKAPELNRFVSTTKAFALNPEIADVAVRRVHV
jgi:hypothetical protein